MSARTLVGVAACLLLAGATAARAGAGAAVYGAQCARCHGASGKADTPAGQALAVPPLAGDAKTAAATAAELAKRIKENPKHAAFIAGLTTEDIDAVAAKVKELAGGK